jgi:hypothetical protein
MSKRRENVWRNEEGEVWGTRARAQESSCAEECVLLKEDVNGGSDRAHNCVLFDADNNTLTILLCIEYNDTSPCCRPCVSGFAVRTLPFLG